MYRNSAWRERSPAFLNAYQARHSAAERNTLSVCTTFRGSKSLMCGRRNCVWAAMVSAVAEEGSSSPEIGSGRGARVKTSRVRYGEERCRQPPPATDSPETIGCLSRWPRPKGYTRRRNRRGGVQVVRTAPDRQRRAHRSERSTLARQPQHTWADSTTGRWGGGAGVIFSVWFGKSNISYLGVSEHDFEFLMMSRKCFIN